MSIKQFVFGTAMFLSVSAFAQQTDPAAVASKDIPQTAQSLQMAGMLVKYGYQTKTALPLIQAVQIYKNLNVTDATPQEPKQHEGAKSVSNITKTDVVSFNEKQLLADATTFADGNKTLLALIKDAESSTRGATDGPHRISDKVLAYDTDIWKFRFRGGENAIVMVIGDGDTDLDLYIYDENSNLITSDTDPDDNCVCTFTPRWTGTFYIKIVNRGNVYNRYVLITN